MLPEECSVRNLGVTESQPTSATRVGLNSVAVDFPQVQTNLSVGTNNLSLPWSQPRHVKRLGLSTKGTVSVVVALGTSGGSSQSIGKQLPSINLVQLVTDGSHNF